MYDDNRSPKVSFSKYERIVRAMRSLSATVMTIVLWVTGCTSNLERPTPTTQSITKAEKIELNGILPQSYSELPATPMVNGAPSVQHVLDQVSLLVGGLLQAWANYFTALEIPGGSIEPTLNVVDQVPHRNECDVTVTGTGQTSFCSKTDDIFVPLETVRELWTNPDDSLDSPQDADIALVAALAHVVGHYIYSELLKRLSLPPLGENTPEYELIADCFAGLSTRSAYGADLRGAELEAAIEGLNALSRPAGASPELPERAAAFLQGHGDYAVNRCAVYWPSLI